MDIWCKGWLYQVVMFVKIFEQIMDSSVATNWRVRVVFMDLLILADSEGFVDKTPVAIARRTGLPLEMVVEGLAELEAVDPDSRSKAEEGRRIVRIDGERSWGWRIVNYAKYRQMRNEEARREYLRVAKARYRKGRERKKRDAVMDEEKSKPGLAEKLYEQKFGDGEVE